MQNHQEVCGTKDEVWFEIHPKEGKEFLEWAKSLGCIWINGKEIEPEQGADFFHFTIQRDGRLANVAMYAWLSKHTRTYLSICFVNTKRVNSYRQKIIGKLI